MRTVSEAERKEISVDILSELDMICRRYGLTYYLAYGTLIGAVRHKGYIPWDDDIDIWVPIDQIEELYIHLEKESKYRLINHFSDINWCWPFSKLIDDRTIDVDIDKSSYEAAQTKRGQAIDIFPLFRVESVNSKSIIEMKKCQKNIEILFKYDKGFFKDNILKRVYCKALLMCGKTPQFYRNKMYDLEKKCKNGAIMGYPFSPYLSKDLHDVNLFEITELKFEGKTFYAPAGYDQILTDIYGDYMTPPPADKQVTRHLTYQTFWKE